MPFYANAGCGHLLCEKEIMVDPEVEQFQFDKPKWKNGRLHFKFYSHDDGYCNPVKIKSNGRLYSAQVGISSRVGFGSGWVKGSVELPKFDPNIRLRVEEVCECVRYREPTAWERLTVSKEELELSPTATLGKIDSRGDLLAFTVPACS